VTAEKKVVTKISSGRKSTDKSPIALKKRSLSCCQKFKKLFEKPKEEMSEENFDIEKYSIPTFSSGLSEFSAEQEFIEMNEEKQHEHIIELWGIAKAKLIGAVKIINMFGDINRRIYLHGKRKALKMKLMEEERLR